MKIFKLCDTVGKPLKWRFSTWLEAHQFRNLMCRPDWKIIELKGTQYAFKGHAAPPYTK